MRLPKEQLGAMDFNLIGKGHPALGYYVFGASTLIFIVAMIKRRKKKKAQAQIAQVPLTAPEKK